MDLRTSRIVFLVFFCQKKFVYKPDYKRLTGRRVKKHRQEKQQRIAKLSSQDCDGEKVVENKHQLNAD